MSSKADSKSKKSEKPKATRPEVEILDVVIDEELLTYTIKPTIFSEWSLTRLKKLVVERKKAERVEFLKSLKEAGFDGPDLAAAVGGAFRECGSADIHEVIALLQGMDRDVLSIALQATIDGVDEKQAAKIIASVDDIADLVEKITSAGLSAEEAAEKN